ncbi:putative hydrolase of the HAD superfamily [Candidatus Zixiibacteriota bacterium]|nr:putative hydrolase of the HAD superfamily [candidate division Zixibacteria bacterium]
MSCGCGKISVTMNTIIKNLFLDIGGVLLTNGWDRRARQAAVERFDLDFDELNERHHLTYDTYEAGKLSLDEYLHRVIFFKKRSFRPEDFKQFILERSRPHADMMDFVRNIKTRYNLKSVAISNEGRELTDYRIREFNLASIIDIFVSSCYVHLRKPDLDIYRTALEISRSEPDEVLYIDDRAMFVEVAATLGIHGIYHKDLESTRQALAGYGLII